MRRLSVCNLRVHYPLEEAAALDDISFQLDQGETLLVVGASGSGKSTLALALCGLIPRAVEAELSGSALIDGVDADGLQPGEGCRRVGVVFQDPEAQFCMLTVEDEIAFGLENAGIPRLKMDRLIDESLGAVNLGQHRKTRLDRLSGGMKQKLALACTLATRPPILIFDEPTANLDPVATDEFFDLLAGIARARRHALVIIEHKLEVPALLADRVLVLDQGKIKRLGRPREVFASAGEELRRIGVWQPFASEVAASLATGEGDRLTPHPLTPEEIVEAVGGHPTRVRAIRRVLSALRRTPTRSFSGESYIPEPGDETSGGPRLTGERSMSDPALLFTDVSFSYRTPQGRIPVLDAFNWQVSRGRFVALVGSNGAGKSTVAQLALGLLQPDSGSIRLLGHTVERTPHRQLAGLAGYVFQNPEHQFVTDTVFDEVAYSMCTMGHECKGISKRLWELLEEFQLHHRADANPFSLSQGEKRRLSVATMLAADQSLLILDEPTFGQDHANAYRLMDRIAARRRSGCTVIMITHDMRLVWEYAEDLAVIVAGKLRYTGSVDDFFNGHDNGHDIGYDIRGDIMKAARLHPPPAVQVLRGLSTAWEASSS